MCLLKKYLKKMKNNTLIYIAIILSIFIFIIYYFNNNIINYILDKNINNIDTIYTTKIDTIYSTDTFKIIKPIPKYIEKIKTDTVFDKKGDSIFLKTENKQYIDTLSTCAGDTMEVMSYISGINAVQDSLKVKLLKQGILKTETKTITKYITPKKKFLDHFKIGIGVGYGYGFSSKQFEPYAGISLNYNF